MDARGPACQFRDQQTSRRQCRHLPPRQDEAELTEVYDRLTRAEQPIVEAKATTCCYARSHKKWIADPQGVPWETFFTYGEAEVYGEGSLAKLREANERATCGCEPPFAELAPEPAAEDACCSPSCCA